jgi:ribosomal protein L29
VSTGKSINEMNEDELTAHIEGIKAILQDERVQALNFGPSQTEKNRAKRKRRKHRG